MRLEDALHACERVFDAWGQASATTSEVVRRQVLTFVFGCGDRVPVSGCRWMASTRRVAWFRPYPGGDPYCRAIRFD